MGSQTMEIETGKSLIASALPVAEWMYYGSADEKYRAFVSVSEFRCSSDALSRTESEVFGIKAKEVPGLFWAFRRYENLVGLDEFFGEFADQERIDHAAFFRSEHQWSFDLAVGFMVSACKLSLPKSLGWVSKVVASRIRCGEYGGNCQ
jgi:hypothetical protein